MKNSRGVVMSANALSEDDREIDSQDIPLPVNPGINLGMGISDGGGPAYRAYTLEAWQRQYPCYAGDEWKAATVSIDAVRAVVDTVFDRPLQLLRQSVDLDGKGRGNIVLSLPGTIVAYIGVGQGGPSSGQGQVSPQMFAHNPADIIRLHKALQAAFPAPVPTVLEPRINVNFWMQGEQGGGSNYTRTLEVLSWEPTRGNYTASVVAGLDAMMDFRPSTAGQLFLWHGPPGTGKTYALRALAWQWRHWCDLHYISDPFSLLAGGPRYMNDVLLSETDGYLINPWFLAETEEVQKTVLRDDNRWRLLVLEDAGELMRADAQQVAGPALGRLLNMVDGLLGQGLKFLVLITTNEPLEKLHPAVTRPGRCAAQVEFAPLTRKEAEQFIAAKGLPSTDAARSMTIAELYELSAKQIAVKQTKGGNLGFK